MTHEKCTCLFCTHGLSAARSANAHMCTWLMQSISGPFPFYERMRAHALMLDSQLLTLLSTGVISKDGDEFPALEKTVQSLLHIADRQEANWQQFDDIAGERLKAFDKAVADGLSRDEVRTLILEGKL